MVDQANTISTQLVKAIEDRVQQLNNAGLYGQAASLYNNAQERFRFSHQQYSDFLKNQGLPQRSAAELADWSQSVGATGAYNGQPMDMDAQSAWIQQNTSGAIQPVQTATKSWSNYLNSNPDVKNSYAAYKQGGGDLSEADFAAYHYNNYGRSEGRTWDGNRPTQVGGQSGTATGSVAAQAAVAPATLTPTGTFAATAPLSTSAAQAYFNANPDVARAYQQNSYGMTPQQFAQQHFARYGSVEGRNLDGQQGTTASAATQAYFAANPDIARSYASNSLGLSPDQFAQEHYNRYGSVEGRSLNNQQGTTASAATQRYFNANPDVAQAWASRSDQSMTPDQFATYHYNNYGRNENRTNPGLQTTQPVNQGQTNLETIRQQAASGFSPSSVIGGLFADTFKYGLNNTEQQRQAAWSSVSPFGMVGEQQPDWAKYATVPGVSSIATTPATTPTTTPTTTAGLGGGGNGGGTAGQSPSSSMWGLMDFADSIASINPSLAAWMRTQAAAGIGADSAAAQARGGTATTLGAAGGGVAANPMAADPATVAGLRNTGYGGGQSVAGSLGTTGGGVAANPMGRDPSQRGDTGE